MTIYNLPKDFKIGSSASAFQTEGWDGKEEHQRHFVDMMYEEDYERWYQNIGPFKATDFYNRFREDISIMKEIGMEVYRTSIDWSRFITDYEENTVSVDAVRFYNEVIDTLIENGITPMICLEHWEVPEYLINKYGTWDQRIIVDYYVKYAKKVIETFGHKVKYWWSINEPGVVPNCGYMYGEMWPYIEDAKVAVKMNYHRVLATSRLVEWYKKQPFDGKLGIILDPAPAYPKSIYNPKDVEAAHISDLFNYRNYADPLINGSFHEDYFKILKKHNVMFEYKDEDFQIIKENPIMALGVNYYRPSRIKQRVTAWNPDKSFLPTYYYETDNPRGLVFNKYRGWEIYPEGLYDLLHIIKKDYQNIECWITENGIGVQDEERFKNENGEIQDDYRIEYMSEHLACTVRAVEEGVNCKGFLNWGFTDNVSPINAFRNRYGIVEIDLDQSRDRRIKKSGKWFKNVSKTRTFTARSFTKENK